jgi:dolichyl-diphosphooligosaccharide--protein glycosyltransferase
MPTEKSLSAGFFNQAGIRTLLVIVTLTAIWITGFMTRLFSVIRYESIIHEFDPWYVFV